MATVTFDATRAINDQVERIRRRWSLKWSTEERASWLSEFAEVDPNALRAAVDELVAKWDGKHAPRPHDLHKFVRGLPAGERPASTRSYLIVCESCGEKRNVGPGDSGWGTHHCWAQTRVADWRRMPVAERPPSAFTEAERAEIQARGLAACTGKPERVAGGKGGGHGE